MRTRPDVWIGPDLRRMAHLKLWRAYANSDPTPIRLCQLMRILRIAPILIVLVCSEVRADETVLRISSNFAGLDVDFVLTASRLAKAPRWLDSSDNPPLPPRK